MELQQYNVFELIEAAKTVRIPFYQRDYTWGAEEVIKLVEDIWKNDVKHYYLGTIILRAKGASQIIIDGQQRITTLLLIFKTLSDKLNEMGSNKYSSLENYINIEYNSENLKNGNYLKMILRNENHKFNDHDFASSLFNNNYKELRKYFANNKRLSDLEFFYKQLEKVFIATVFIDEKVNEFVLFEQINSTGKKLTSYDLVKNYLLSKIWDTYEQDKENEKHKKIQDKLEKMSVIFDHLPNETERSSLIRHFISSITGNLVSKNGDIIYRKFKDLLEDNESKFFREIDDIFNALYEYGTIYNFIINWESSEYKPYLRSLKLLNQSFGTYATLIVNIISNNSSIENGIINFSQNNLDEIKKSLLIMETYFIRRLFCDYEEKTITRYIPRIQKLIKQMNDSSLLYSEKLLYVIDYLPRKSVTEYYSYQMPNKMEFENSFKTFPIYQKAKFCKLFLERLSENKYNDQSTKNFSIEHIFPQKMDKWISQYNYDSSTVEKFVNKINTIGNLTLTHSKLNSTMSNEIFEIKKEILAEQDCFYLNKYFNKLDRWDLEAINERTIKLFKKTNELINIDNIYKNLKDENGNFINFDILDEAEEIAKNESINYEAIHGNQIKKNLSHFKKIWPLDFEKVEELLQNFFMEGDSMVPNEKKIFNQSFDGWIIKSIFEFLKVSSTLEKGNLIYKDFKIKIKELTPFINQMINYIDELINNN